MMATQCTTTLRATACCITYILSYPWLHTNNCAYFSHIAEKINCHNFLYAMVEHCRKYIKHALAKTNNLITIKQPVNKEIDFLFVFSFHPLGAVLKLFKNYSLASEL